MGFLDSILGKTKLPEAKTDKLFAISTAAITMEANLGLKPDGAAAVCIVHQAYGVVQVRSRSCRD
jgi:hypothetical protein